MKKTIGLVGFLVAVALAGCASTAEIQAKRVRIQETTPTCGSPKECELKWAAARRWVLQNAAWKIQSITGDFIETYNPAQYSPAIAVRVIREPIDAEWYRIVVTIWCNNVFGCVPDASDAALA